MKIDYREYSPKPEQLKQLPFYWEVWRGLPKLPYQRVESATGLSSSLYNRDGHYIWIPHEAFISHEKNPDTLFMVMNKKSEESERKRKGSKINAIWLIPANGSLDEVISKATNLNEGMIKGRANGRRRPRYRH